MFVFGFSRGAYAARMLAGMIYISGVPDIRADPRQPNHPDNSRLQGRIKCVYEAQRSNGRSLQYRADRVARVIRADSEMREWRMQRATIAFMGLFDTVEELNAIQSISAIYKRRELRNIEPTNKHHVDQLCNVRKVAHAMSLDDNRADTFTPKLLTRKVFAEMCLRGERVEIDSVVHEVWFAGAHSDVGGRRDTELDDVPLNWMIKQMEPYDLLRGDTLYADPHGKASKPRDKAWKWIFYPEGNRRVELYLGAESTRYNAGRLKVHQSVISRLESDSVPRHRWQSEWYTAPLFRSCFSVRNRPKSTDRIKRTDSLHFTPTESCRVNVER